RAKLEDKVGYTLHARSKGASERHAREVMLEVDCQQENYAEATMRLCQSIQGNPNCLSALEPAVDLARKRCLHGGHHTTVVQVPIDVDTRRYLEVELDGVDVVIAAWSEGEV
ncbi:unnamed protein product, partial [Choristocarpus tenellus]